jgi:hypothetical protein
VGGRRLVVTAATSALPWLPLTGCMQVVAGCDDKVAGEEPLQCACCRGVTRTKAAGVQCGDIRRQRRVSLRHPREREGGADPGRGVVGWRRIRALGPDEARVAGAVEGCGKGD